MAFPATKTGPHVADWRRRITLLGLLLPLLAGCARAWNGTPPAGAARSRPFRFMARGVVPVSADALKTARFVDVAEASGLRYAWTIPGKRPLTILQTIGNGCAFLDYDNDGWLDILLVGPRLALYRNETGAYGSMGVREYGSENGTPTLPYPHAPTSRFRDVTHITGLDRFTGHFLGCAVGDIDNDGYDDLYISGYRTGLLLRNEEAEGVQGFRRNRRARTILRRISGVRGDPERLNPRTPAHRVFRDITREAGLRPQPWGTSCAFADVNRDGRLDLYVCNYVDFGPDTEPQLCVEQGVETACEPQSYHPLKGVLYRNDGKGRFTEVTQDSGVAEVAGKGLGAAFADFDNSGRPGLAIANDEMPGDLLRPVKRAAAPRYENVGVASGTAYDRDGNLHAGMGIDWGDYDNDGRLDLFVTTFANEPRSLYRNDGKGRFSDLGMQAGFGAEAARYVAFGCKFFDYDNDGWLDIVIANGHVQDNIAAIYGNQTYRQPTQLFHNTGGKYPRFEDVSPSSPDLMRPLVGRGLAVGDYDNDGRVDVLVVDSEGRPLLLHNESRPAGRWLGVRLVGTRSNRNGYGALLMAKVGNRTLLRQCQTGGSYLSASDPRVHFGLGRAKRVDRLTIRWPGGQVDTFKNLTADRYVTIREGD